VSGSAALLVIATSSSGASAAHGWIVASRATEHGVRCFARAIGREAIRGDLVGQEWRSTGFRGWRAERSRLRERVIAAGIQPVSMKRERDV
jgi:hypothetical protein